MRKTRKQVLGFLGLGMVVATTIFAASLPGPDATAIDSVQDTVTLTVLGTSPDVSISGITNNETTILHEKTFTVNYNDVGTVRVDLTYTDAEGHESSGNIAILNPNFEPGSDNFTLSMNDWYGYGKYVITVSGEGSGAGDEDSVVFYYSPITAGNITNKDDGKTDVEILYDNFNAISEAGDEKIEYISVTLYDANRNPIPGFVALKVQPDPTTGKVIATIDFASLGLSEGKYIIGLTAYGVDENVLYKTLYFDVEYKPGGGSVTPIPVPDTGHFMEELNISKTDFLITGIIIFTIVGAGGAIFITRRDKKNIGKGQKR